MTKYEILELVEQEDVEFIRLQFTDMFGNIKNVAVTVSQLKRVLDNKYVFEGSALYDEGRICADDLYLYPDLDTFVILPWRPQQGKVARLLCDVHNEDGTPCDLSPRTILKNVLKRAKQMGYEIYADPECEFFLFHTDENGIPTTLTHENAGYMAVGPMDLGENPRRDIVLTLEDMGFMVESSHHEKSPGQQGIYFREAEALAIADSVVTFRSAVRSTARRFGLHATFMPKPKKGEAGSGMHMNFSIYKDGRSIFNPVDEGIRQEAGWFMGGIMNHARGMCAVTNPLVNSYKRINSGFEAPKDIAWSLKNENALLRLHSVAGEDTKVEVRFPDSSANPYLTIALCLMAGIDGIEKKISCGKSYGELKKENAPVERLPESLKEAINEMKKDEFVKDVLGEEFFNIYIDSKNKEWKEYLEEVTDWEVSKYLNRV